jgi:hypothetical protein
MRHALAPPTPLLGRPPGIEAFRVEGWIQVEPVYAHWDGRWLLMSTTLREYATVAFAVEAAFTDAGSDSAGGSFSGSSPEEVMLTLVTCCDEIEVAEYELRGELRAIRASS